jgi:glycosyltransferase involved in cell wall biosynthesis
MNQHFSPGIESTVEKQPCSLQKQILDTYNDGDDRQTWEFCLNAINLDSQQPVWIYVTAINLSAQMTFNVQAEVVQRKAVETHPSSDEIYRSIGMYFKSKNNKQKSIENYLQALKLNLQQPDWIYAHLIATLVDLGHSIQATRIGEQGSSLYPNSYWIHYHLGEAYRDQQNWHKSLENFYLASRIDPDADLSSTSIKSVLLEQKLVLDNQLAYQTSISTLFSAEKNNSCPLYVLNTHPDDVSGLGVVAAQCQALGELVNDSRSVAGKILVAGRPDIYQELVRFENLNYIWTTFESTVIPQTWVKSINEKFEQVFVPHTYIKKVFLDSGVKRNIEIIPQRFVDRQRIKPITKQKAKLVLGVLGVPNQRKNFDKLVEAVNQIYREGFDIKLKIHSPILLNRVQSEWNNYKAIDLTVGSKSDRDINHWYSQLDAYIFPSSGEGWSFTPRESMSLGIPTIVSDIPLHQELIDSGFYLPIRSGRWESAYFEFLESSCGQWKAYSIENIKASIIQLIEEYDDWSKKALAGKQWILDNTMSWQEIKQLLKEKLASF